MQSIADLKLELLSTQKNYIALGSSETHPEHFFMFDSDNEEAAQFHLRLFHVALVRTKENLDLALNALGSAPQFLDRLALAGIRLEIVKSDDESLNNTDGKLCGAAFDCSGKEIRVMIPVERKHIQADELKQLMLQLWSILHAAGVQTDIAPSRLTYRAAQVKNALRETENAINQQIEQANYHQQIKAGPSEIAVLNQDQINPPLIATHIPRCSTNMLLPFSHHVLFLQVQITVHGTVVLFPHKYIFQSFCKFK